MTALAVGALALTLLWVVVPGWTYNLAVGTNHLIDHLSSRLAADAGRLFPSMVRPRAATWGVPVLITPLMILFWWFPRRRPRHASAWATAGFLTLVAAVPVVATGLSSSRIELEDRQVAKSGGSLYPGPWTPYRPQFRGGWAVAAGESVRVPVVPGGARAAIHVDVKSIGPAPSEQTLEALVDGTPPVSLVVSTRAGWQTLTLDRVDWPAGADLVLAVPPDEWGDNSGGIVLDRVQFDWQ